MNAIQEISKDDFNTGLTDLSIKLLQVVALGLSVAPLVFASIVVYLGVSGWGPDKAPEAGVAIAYYMSWVHLAVLLIAVPLTVMTVSRRFSQSKLDEYAEKGIYTGNGGGYLKEPKDIALYLVRLSWLVPTAAIEGAALAGILAAFFAVNEGSIHQSGFYWLNLATVGLVLLRATLAFPTRDRLNRIFVSRVKKVAP